MRITRSILSRPVGSKNKHKYIVSEEHRHNMAIANKLRSGNKNHNWKGDKVGDRALHNWVNKHLPQQDICQICGLVSPHDLANITGVYNREFKNWLRICRKCHMLSDGRLLKQILRMRSYGLARRKMF